METRTHPKVPITPNTRPTIATGILEIETFGDGKRDESQLEFPRRKINPTNIQPQPQLITISGKVYLSYKLNTKVPHLQALGTPSLIMIYTN